MGTAELYKKNKFELLLYKERQIQTMKIFPRVDINFGGDIDLQMISPLLNLIEQVHYDFPLCSTTLLYHTYFFFSL